MSTYVYANDCIIWRIEQWIQDHLANQSAEKNSFQLATIGYGLEFAIWIW